MIEEHVCTDRPRLTLTGGISRRTATDEHNNHFVEFEVDTFAEQEPGTCACCGDELFSGWLCLDGGEEWCTDCVEELDEPAPTDADVASDPRA